MGVWTDTKIAAWQEAAGIEPAKGDRAELLQQMSDMAFHLIKVIELEKSGIRDGDGRWYGSDAMRGTAADMARLCGRWAELEQLSYHGRRLAERYGEPVSPSVDAEIPF